MGELLGVAAGEAIIYAIPAEWPSLPARMLVLWIGFGFGLAAAESLLFGIYPAWKAAHLDPIESLRFE